MDHNMSAATSIAPRSHIAAPDANPALLNLPNRPIIPRSMRRPAPIFGGWGPRL